VGQLAADNERLVRDNERLCRVIDSGDWGRQRVEELLRAGQVLQEERDGLARLVGGLQQQPDAERGLATARSATAAGCEPSAHSHPAALGHAEKLRPAAVASGLHPTDTDLIAAQRPAGDAAASENRATRGPRNDLPAAARNQLLVRTGSSFNAMVRALKQDLLASGTLHRDSEALYEVDKVSS
jgi:hypothetical protein